MRLNILKHYKRPRLRTHEGAPAATITPEQALRRSVLACMLWEGEFYEDGVEIAGRIANWSLRSLPRRLPRWPLRRASR